MNLEISFYDTPEDMAPGEVGIPHAEGVVSLQNAEYLPVILRAFQRSLHMMGFEYVTGLTAHTASEITHTSAEF